MTNSSTSQQIKDSYSPLDALALRALRRYGEMSPSTKDAETMLMFMDYANAVLDDIMAHPYWTKGYELAYYQHTTESRPVPDTLLLTGLLSKYSIDQTSAKAAKYEQDYFATLNKVLARVRFGVGAEFQLMGVDYVDTTQTTPGVV